MPVLYKLKKNNNRESNGYGKIYAKLVKLKTMTYKELCKHMSEHNSIYGEDVCSGVAIKLQNCILEQLLEGRKVEFGDLGTFYLSMKSAGADTEDDFNVNSDITGLYLRFTPSRKDINDLSSKALKKKASFMNVKNLVNGKTTSTSSGGDNNSGGGTVVENP